MTRKNEARRGWFYVPFPKEMADGLDNILEREHKRYGVLKRIDLMRLIIGQFIRVYDQSGILLFDEETLRMLRPFESKEEDNDDDDDKSNPFIKKSQLE